MPSASRSSTTSAWVAEHARSSDRYQTIYNPWHYVPALATKPGALRNGAPFADWSLPGIE
jgi:hypothetical protein